jgi:hypothetical protein
VGDVGVTLLDALSDELARSDVVPGGGIVTAFAVLVEFVDVDGETSIYHETAENQRCHTTLGLLEFGAAIERNRAVESARDDD